MILPTWADGGRMRAADAFACVFFAVALAALWWWAFWLQCRLRAAPCPNCGSKWRTTLVGEWDGEEDWKCVACGHTWGVPYRK